MAGLIGFVHFVTFAGMNFMKRIFIYPIRLYQRFLSPLLGKNCRFEPTCSHYTAQAIEEWGVFKGMWLGIRRIARCHPWGGFGFDPVPKKEPIQPNEN
jgi:putative membrane protein insertion efficiency factor